MSQGEQITVLVLTVRRGAKMTRQNERKCSNNPGKKAYFLVFEFWLSGVVIMACSGDCQ
jgi:hypothetical protein